MEKNTPLSDLDDMFEEMEKETSPKPYSYANEVMEKAEGEYKRPRQELNEREKEKAELNKRLVDLKRKLNQSKNVRNVRLVGVNQNMATKRKLIREEIERIKDKLYQIDIEEQGAEITSKDIINAGK